MDFLSKNDLRKDYKERRGSLSREDSNDLNQRLLDQFTAFPLRGIHYIHFFLPIHKYNEPDTYPLIHWLLLTHPALKVVVSRINTGTLLLENFIWEGYDNLQRNKWGMDEPISGEKVLPQELDAVIVPLLAYDQEGNRVGYGKGYYDRFLADCRADCRKIGLSFFEPESKIVDIEPYDIRLDFCISPNKCRSFS